VDRSIIGIAQQRVSHLRHPPKLQLRANEPSPIIEHGIAGNVCLCKVPSIVQAVPLGVG
jgi:hypothetical protein